MYSEIRKIYRCNGGSWSRPSNKKKLFFCEIFIDQDSVFGEISYRPRGIRAAIGLGRLRAEPQGWLGIIIGAEELFL